VKSNTPLDDLALSRHGLEMRCRELQHQLTAAQRALDEAQRRERLAERSALEAWHLVRMLRGSTVGTRTACGPANCRTCSGVVC
jgi:hypothetical protein